MVEEALQHSRMERIGDDFLGEILIRANAYLLRWIIHDWDDDKAVTILENVRSAARPGARLVLVESVIPETADCDMSKWMDMNMLVMVGGHERTSVKSFARMYCPGVTMNVPHEVTGIGVPCAAPGSADNCITKRHRHKA